MAKVTVMQSLAAITHVAHILSYHVKTSTSLPSIPVITLDARTNVWKTSPATRSSDTHHPEYHSNYTHDTLSKNEATGNDNQPYALVLYSFGSPMIYILHETSNQQCNGEIWHVEESNSECDARWYPFCIPQCKTRLPPRCQKDALQTLIPWSLNHFSRMRLLDKIRSMQGNIQGKNGMHLIFLDSYVHDKADIVMYIKIE